MHFLRYLNYECTLQNVWICRYGVRLVCVCVRACVSFSWMFRHGALGVCVCAFSKRLSLFRVYTTVCVHMGSDFCVFVCVCVHAFSYLDHESTGCVCADMELCVYLCVFLHFLRYINYECIHYSMCAFADMESASCVCLCVCAFS